MREQLKRNERRGMKLIGIGRPERQDRTRPPEPPTCGCEYVKAWQLQDEYPQYVLTQRCAECAEREWRA